MSDEGQPFSRGCPLVRNTIFMRKQKYNIPVIIALILWLAALAAATVYDLEISLSIADENSVFGRILEIFGEPPAILFASFNFSLMLAHFIKKDGRKCKDIIFSAVCLLLSVGTVIFTVFESADYLAEWLTSADSAPIAIKLAVSAVISVLILFNGLRMSKESADKYFETACRCAAVAVLTLAVIWAFKLTWGRVRFRQLESLSDFTSWYLPNGFNGYFSFPSGHTANATVIFTTTYYFKFIPQKYEKIKSLLYALLIVWIVLVAFSRVIAGAHYLSDVLFGGAITFGIVYFVKPKHTS